MNLTCSELNTIDLRNESSVSSFVYLPYELMVRNIIWPIISLMGLVGNTLFIWTVIKVSVLHTSTFIALSALACTDSLSLIGRLTEHFSDSITSPLRYGESSIPASIGGNLTWFCFMMSIWLVTLVSTEGFLAICHPIKYRVLKGTTRMLGAIGVLVVVSVGFTCVSIPYTLKFAEYCFQWPPTEQFIMYPRKAKLIKVDYLNELPDPYFLTGLINSLAITIMLFLINCYMNTRTLKTLRTRTQNKRLQISTQFERNIRQISVMVIANGVVFFVCIYTFVFTLTSQILIVVGIRFFTEYQIIVLENITQIFLLINSSINPIVYFIANQSYRQSFNKTVLGGLCKSTNSKSPTVPTEADAMCESQNMWRIKHGEYNQKPVDRYLYRFDSFHLTLFFKTMMKMNDVFFYILAKDR